MKTFTGMAFDDIPVLIAAMVIVNSLILLKTLVPFLEPAFFSTTVGLIGLLILTKINEERMLCIIGKKISAIFSKNHLISLISILFLSLLNFSWITIHQIMR